MFLYVKKSRETSYVNVYIEKCYYWQIFMINISIKCVVQINDELYFPIKFKFSRHNSIKAIDVIFKQYQNFNDRIIGTQL